MTTPGRGGAEKADARPASYPLSAHFPPPMQVSTFFGVQMSSPV
jgi:hypothetical protein